MRTITVWDYRHAYQAIEDYEKANPRYVVAACAATRSLTGRQGYILTVVSKPKEAS